MPYNACSAASSETFAAKVWLAPSVRDRPNPSDSATAVVLGENRFFPSLSRRTDIKPEGSDVQEALDQWDPAQAVSIPPYPTLLS